LEELHTPWHRLHADVLPRLDGDHARLVERRLNLARSASRGGGGEERPGGGKGNRGQHTEDPDAHEPLGDRETPLTTGFFLFPSRGHGGGLKSNFPAPARRTGSLAIRGNRWRLGGVLSSLELCHWIRSCHCRMTLSSNKHSTPAFACR